MSFVLEGLSTIKVSWTFRKRRGVRKKLGENQLINILINYSVPEHTWREDKAYVYRLYEGRITREKIPQDIMEPGVKLKGKLRCKIKKYFLVARQRSLFSLLEALRSV